MQSTLDCLWIPKWLHVWNVLKLFLAKCQQSQLSPVLSGNILEDEPNVLAPHCYDLGPYFPCCADVSSLLSTATICVLHTPRPCFVCCVRNVLVHMYKHPCCAQTWPFQLRGTEEACLSTEQFTSVCAPLNNTPASHTFCVHTKTVWTKCKYLAANTAYSWWWEILLKKEGHKLI